MATPTKTSVRNKYEANEKIEKERRRKEFTTFFLFYLFYFFIIPFASLFILSITLVLCSSVIAQILVIEHMSQCMQILIVPEQGWFGQLK